MIALLFGAACCNWAEADIPTYRASNAFAQAHPEGRRIALVIGNGNYEEGPLPNAHNDALAMSEALRARGFEVMRYENLTGAQMRDALLAFKRRLGDGGIALFYFSGHGFRVADRTLLRPVDADSRAPRDLLRSGIDLQVVLKSMSTPRQAKLNLIVLDTCMNEPFGAAGSASRIAPDQTMIAYAASPGAFAADGAHHGLFTGALLKAMALPRTTLEQSFALAAAAVQEASGGQQSPWLSSSLPGLTSETRLAGLSLDADESVHTLRSRGVIPKDSAEQYELTFWDSIKDSNHVADYEAYLQAYPNGRFAALAKARIERLRKAAPKTEAPAATPAPATKAPPERPRPTPPAAAKPAPPAAAPERPAPSTAKAGGTIKDCPTCPDMVALPAADFTMGSNASDPSEKPAHHVSIATPFAIGKYEVTVAQWDACVEGGGCQPSPNGSGRPKNTPVRDVSWDDAQQYVKWLTKLSGKSYRLPTEAEWEYAARGGTTTRFWWGNQMQTGKANCKDCGEPWQQEGPTPVGSFAANPFGLHDMNGSVWEWVSDCWHNNYKGAPADGRSWDDAHCRVRVIRGGSWREGASYMPTTTRFKYDASVRHSQNGFRVARDNK
ncbi:SUMF1/EgtB/PvdO family nonheme iron enzyme [Noviherbaspirillum sp.]|uniref:SUMF1/EgtB/PvdO family nonheme iron enzyme n=1 Tax=Noviherbaspirillum sp. TaxID=1926288 RepID=UPI0025FBC755|nr:SUMF1/EgtB/PvdO family nonheme iron enzyme [Noviherbaspirillum sp.]